MMVHLRGLNNWSANVRCVQIHFKYTYGLKKAVIHFYQDHKLTECDR